MADGSIIIDTKLDSTSLDKQLSNLKGSLQNTTDSLNSLTTKALIGFATLGAAISPAIKLASDLNESANAAKVVFGDATDTIQEFGKVAAEQAGLTSAQFNQMAAQIGASLINAGQSQEDAAKQSVELTKRAADMASIFNTDVSEALTAIQAGLRGESEPLRRFAVGLDEAAVSAKAVEMGLAKSTSTVDAYGKSQARLALIMQQSSKFQGDFVNTSDEAANKTRIMTAMVQEEAAQAGQKLLPIVLDVIKGFMDWAKEGDRLRNIMQGMADAIKWATESGFAQGILAAAAALGVATVAMKAFAAASSMTVLGASIVAVGALVGVIVGIGTAIDNNIKKQKEWNAIVTGGSNQSAEEQNKVIEQHVQALLKDRQALEAEQSKMKIGSIAYKTAAAEIANISSEINSLNGIRAKNNKLLDEAAKKQSALNKTPAEAAKIAPYEGTGIKSSDMFSSLQKAIKFTNKLLTDKTPAKVQAEFWKIQEQASKKLADGSISWDEYKSAVGSAASSAVDDMYAMGTAIDDNTDAGRFLKLAATIKSQMKGASAGVVSEVNKADIGYKIMKGIANGMRKGAAMTAQVAKKTIETIGQVLTQGAAIIGEVISGAGSIIQGLADFDPAELYDELEELLEGLEDFFTTDIGASSIYMEAGLKLIKDFVDGLLANSDQINLVLSNAIASMIASIKTYGPSIVAGAIDLMSSFIKTIAEQLPDLLSAGFDIVDSINKGISKNLPDLLETVLEAVKELIDVIADRLPDVLEQGSKIVITLVKGIAAKAQTFGAKIGDLIASITQVIANNTTQLVNAGTQVVVGLVNGIAQSAGKITSSIANLISSIILTIGENLPSILMAAVNIVLTLVTGLLQNLPKIINAVIIMVSTLGAEMMNQATIMIPEITMNITEMIVQGLVDDPLMLNLGFNLAWGIISGLGKSFANLGTKLSDALTVFFNAVKAFFNDPSTSFEKFGAYLIDGFINGFVANLKTAYDSVKSGLGTFVSAIKNFFGIASPSKLFKSFGGYMGDGLVIGFNDTDLFGGVSSSLDDFSSQVAGSTAMQNVLDGLSSSATMAVSVASQAALSSSNSAVANITVPLEVEGREIGRVAFQYVDQFAQVAYGA